jgi:hypothetical protein
MSETTKLTVYANGYRISGTGSVLPGARVTDFMNESKQFIALTDVSVWDIDDGRKVMSSPFININRESVEFVVPQK